MTSGANICDTCDYLFHKQGDNCVADTNAINQLAQQNCQATQNNCGCLAEFRFRGPHRSNSIAIESFELTNGLKVWTDRTFTTSNLPSYLQGTTWARHAAYTTGELHLRFEPSFTGSIYLISSENWLASDLPELEGFEKMAEKFVAAYSYDIWKKQLVGVASFSFQSNVDFAGGLAIDSNC